MSGLIWLSYLSLLILSLLDNIRGPFFPDILADLHLNGTYGAAFFAMTSFFAFLGSWSSHWVLNRRSSVFLLAISSFVMSLGFASIAQVHAYSWMLVACAGCGWGYGALNLAQNVMIYEAAAPRLRRQLFSGLHSMYGLSALFAPLTASAFRWFGLDWRQSFLILAALPLLLIVASRHFHSRRPKTEIKRAVALQPAEWISCLGFALMMACYLWGEVSASTRLVLWMRADLGFSPDLANLYLGGFFLTLFAGRALFSFVDFSSVSTWPILFVSAGLSALLYFLGLYCSPIWMVVCGLSMAPFFPVAMDKISTFFHTKSSQALGFVIGFGSLSIMPMHLVIGRLSDTMGVTHALYVGPASLLAVTLALGVVCFRTMARTAE